MREQPHPPACWRIAGHLSRVLPTAASRPGTGDAARYDRAMPERHFPPPWSVEELDSCFVVNYANVQALACMYFEKEPLSPRFGVRLVMLHRHPPY